MKRFLFFIVLMMAALSGASALVQPGYVKTRGRLDSNGKVIPGKRLPNATVELQSSSSVISNQSGNFNLTVPTSKFYLKNVKKAGYVVSDPDMLSKQYSCSANPLVLVLDEPIIQQDDKLASERKLRRNLQKQLQIREDELEALKHENRITQEQYREALQKLYSDQESNEKFISEMAERYSKIDFDQLDDFQRRMAEFIQNGELARADSLLRSKGNMSDREMEIKKILKANSEEEKELAERQRILGESKKTADALLADYAADCYNHFELCKLRFDNDSAAYWLEKRVELFPDRIDFKIEAGNFIRDFLARYDVALDYYNDALSHLREGNDEGNPDIAACCSSIGRIYLKRGDYAQALVNLMLALKISEEALGENHPGIANCYNSIGEVYCCQGDYTKALEYDEKALMIGMETLGDSHPDTANSFNNIGEVYYSQDVYDRALTYFEEALRIYLEIYGEYHPDVANSYNNVGAAYFALGDFQRGAENLEKSMEVRSRILPENHPAMAEVYNNIGMMYSYQGEYLRAVSNILKALKIRLEVLGESHRDTATSYESLGYVYSDQGYFLWALDNFEKALGILVDIFGENHPEIAVNLYNIGETYYNLGNYEQALDYYNKALAIQMEVLGRDHPKVQAIKLRIDETKSSIR